MPRYDVRCASCQREWEIQRGMNQPNPPCPDCGGAVEQRPSAGTHFTLRGPGWASDNYSKVTKA